MKLFMALFFGLFISTSAIAAPTCRIGMTDSLNHISDEFSVTRTQLGDEEAFIVSSQSSAPFQVSFRGDHMVAVDGITLSSRTEITARFLNTTEPLFKGQSATDGQLTWKALDLSGCDAFEVSLIEFLVFEWFYFG